MLLRDNGVEHEPSAEEYDSLFDEDPCSEIDNSGEEHTGHEDFEG